MQTAGSDQPMELRPRRATELIDVAFQLWRRTFRSLLKVSSVVAVVFASVSAISAFKNVESSELSGGTSGLGIALGPLSIVAVFVYSLALIPVLHNSFVDGGSSTTDALKKGLRNGPKAVAYTLTSLIAFVALALVGSVALLFAVGALTVVSKIGGILGILLLIIIGIVGYVFGLVAILGIGTRFQVGVVAMVIEGVGVFDAIRRGFRLTKGRWLAFGGTQAIIFFLSYLVILIPVGIAFAATKSAGSRQVNFAFASFLGSLLFIFWWVPVYTGLGVAMYVDSRIRREAIDLDGLTGKLSDGWSPTGS